MIRLFHFDINTYENFGDNILFESVRQVFESFGNRDIFEFVGKQDLRSLVTEEVIREINTTCDAVVIGGGGLFLCDTNRNKNSGWQWNCPIPLLEKLEKPVILFAVGNNRFRGQEDFAPVFYKHINLLIKKSLFWGLRNHGSIASIKEYIEDEREKEKIVYQPCPTTLIGCMCEALTSIDTMPPHRISFQIALDRSHLRFQDKKVQIFSLLARLMQRLQHEGFDIDLLEYLHITDHEFVDYLNALEIPYTFESFNDTKDILGRLQYYNKNVVNIAMRGHGQMIPFGMRSPTVSLISHDKLRYFLEDVQLEDCGLEILDKNLETLLYNRVMTMIHNYQHEKIRIQAAQAKLLQITARNLQLIFYKITGKTINASFQYFSLEEQKLRFKIKKENHAVRELSHQNMILQTKLNQITAELANKTHQLEKEKTTAVNTIQEWKQDKWYRFGQMSRKRKIWTIGKVTSKKLHIYWLLHPCAKLVKRIFRKR